MADQGKTIAAGSIAVGGLLLWSALNNKHVLSTAQDVVRGKQPVPGAPEAVNTSVVQLGGGNTGLPYGTVDVSGGLSGGAIKALWLLAGGDPSKANVAVCIAEHESAGRTGVTSSNPDGGTNVGLWQLDTPGGKGAGYTVAELQNPLTNARVAVKGSSNGTDWSAWATASMCGV